MTPHYLLIRCIYSFRYQETSAKPCGILMPPCDVLDSRLKGRSSWHMYRVVYNCCVACLFYEGIRLMAKIRLQHCTRHFSCVADHWDANTTRRKISSGSFVQKIIHGFKLVAHNCKILIELYYFLDLVTHQQQSHERPIQWVWTIFIHLWIELMGQTANCSTSMYYDCMSFISLYFIAPISLCHNIFLFNVWSVLVRMSGNKAVSEGRKCVPKVQ